MKIRFVTAAFGTDPDGEFRYRHGGHDFTWNQALGFEFGLTPSELSICKEIPNRPDKWWDRIYTEPRKGLEFWLEEDKRILHIPHINARTAQRKFRSLDPAKIADGVLAAIRAMLSGR